MKILKKYISVNLCFVLALLIFFNMPVINAHAETEYVLIKYPVTYYQDDARNMLTYINEFRTGDDAWYWNEDNTTKTVVKGLKPLQYDYELEKIAMQRAAEIIVWMEHARPNCTSWASAYENYGEILCSENLLTGAKTTYSAFYLWTESDLEYNKQGHRRNMLSDQHTHVGVACLEYNGVKYWVQEFSKNTDTMHPIASKSIYTDGTVAIPKDKIVGLEISISYNQKKLKKGEQVMLPTVSAWMNVDLTGDGIINYKPPMDDFISYSISNSCISVDNRYIHAENMGMGELTYSVDFAGWSNKKTISVDVTDIVSVEELKDVTTNAGSTPLLPTGVKVKWSDGSKTNRHVTWEELPDTYKNKEGGSFDLKGYVEGYDTPVIQHVIVKPAYVLGAYFILEDGSTKTITKKYKTTVENGIKPELPQYAKVYWSTSDVTTDPIVWNSDDLANVKYNDKDGGKYIVNGSVDGRDLSAEITVKELWIPPWANNTSTTEQENNTNESDTNINYPYYENSDVNDNDKIDVEVEDKEETSNEGDTDVTDGGSKDDTKSDETKADETKKDDTKSDETKSDDTKSDKESTSNPKPIGDKYSTYESCDFYRDEAGDTRCYDSTGAPVINEFKCDGTYTYYFQLDGTAMKDRLSYHPDGEHVIYFDAEGHEVFSDFANVKKTIAGEDVNDFCFFNVFGYMYVDVLTYDKTGTYLYYANPYGVMEMGKWFQFSDSVEWADGTPAEGIAGGYGYANENGTLLTNTQTVDWEGRSCYLQGNGVAAY